MKGAKRSTKNKEKGVSFSFSIRSLILHCTYIYLLSMYVAKVAGFSPSTYLFKLVVCLYNGTPSLGPIIGQRRSYTRLLIFPTPQMPLAPHPLIIYALYPSIIHALHSFMVFKFHLFIYYTPHSFIFHALCFMHCENYNKTHVIYDH